MAERNKKRYKRRKAKNEFRKKEVKAESIKASGEKILFKKPGNFLYPVPAVMVSCSDKSGKSNIITVAWAGTICSDPPMLSIAVRKERFSHHMIKESGEFVVNLVNKDLAKACDFCGCRSGKDLDKFKECNLTEGKSFKVLAPSIKESPVSIECKTKEVIELGSHDLFLAEVIGVSVDSGYLDDKKSFHLEKADLIAYSHGKYHELGKIIGTFGYSVRKKKK